MWLNFLVLAEVDILYFQVIPQAICTRYGLAVGANFVWLVRILMITCYPVAYPIGKVIGTTEIATPEFCVKWDHELLDKFPVFF